MDNQQLPCPEWRVFQSMVFCFRDGHRLLMGKYIYSQNSPSTPAPPGPERGSITRSNVNMPMPPEWFWKAPPDPALFPHPKSPSTATRLRPTSLKSKTIAITKPASRLPKSKRSNRFSLSLGERAGVRASVRPYFNQLPNSVANPAKSNQIKPPRTAPTPLISANHPVRLSITPFPGSIRPKTAVNRTKSNQIKPGLLTLLTRVSQTCLINT